MCPSNYAPEQSKEQKNEQSSLRDDDIPDRKLHKQFPSADPATSIDEDGSPKFFIDGTDNTFCFSEKTVRMAFIRKVYAILMVQLAVTVGCISLFVFVPSIVSFSSGHPELMSIALGLSICLVIALVCYSDLRRHWPLNIVMLGLFTLCEGFMLGAISSHYSIEEVLIAAGICTVVCLALTIFSVQTKWDFTSKAGILLVLSIILLIAFIVAIFVPGKITQLIYASIGALVFSAYLVFDTQMMLGGRHKYSISPEEYIFAALNLYLDMINIYIYILALFGGSR